MASPLLEIVGALLGGGALGTLGKGWLDRRKGQDQIAAEREKDQGRQAAESERAYYTSLEARITKLEAREDELQEELKLRIEREGELDKHNALLQQELDTLKQTHAALLERGQLQERMLEEVQAENRELRAAWEETRRRHAELSAELAALRGDQDQLATLQFDAPEVE